MSRSPVLRDHVATAILDAAATVLAEQGETASMADVATAAGVGRTTLYRYFPNREALLHALTRAAFAELADRLARVDLDTVAVPEAIARVTRAVFGAAGKYRALTRANRKPEQPREIGEQLVEPLNALFRRGIADGTWRTDLGADTLLTVYTGLLEGALSQGLHERLGVEPAAAAITSVFVDGAAAVRSHRPAH